MPSVRPLFVPPAPERIDADLQAYAVFLERRDGAPDFEQRTLALREQDTVRLESSGPCYDGPFDAALFERQNRRYDAAAPTPPEMQLLLCLVKINANEAYGVERVTRRPASSPIERIVLLEESYHTRLLLSASRLFGVQVERAAAPSPLTRAIVAGIAHLPAIAARPVTLAGEVVGIVTFLRTIAAIRRVFQDRPVVRDALEERVTEVLVDEVGHLSFNRLTAEPGTFAALRAVLPAVALGTRGALPEGELLGILPVPVREAWGFEPAALPEEVRRRAFVA
jgi:hypothetical protein